jgi:hypothetical protein
MKTKKCCTCKEIKNTSEFYNTKTNKDGLSRRCKLCANASVGKWQKEHREERNAWARKHNAKNRVKVRVNHRRNRRCRDYNLTEDQYVNMLATQDNCCAICRTPFLSETEITEGVRSETKTKPHIDHCHTTGRVRGVLCYRCNHTLGRVKDGRCNRQPRGKLRV